MNRAAWASRPGGPSASIAPSAAPWPSSRSGPPSQQDACVYGGPKWTVSTVYEGMLKEEMDAAAARYPDVPYRPTLIDAAYAGLLTESSGSPLVIPALNRDGDCLSDLVLALFGSIAGAESVLLALDDEMHPVVAMAEAPHGTAPSLMGKNVANPMAMLLACAAVLDHAAQGDGDGGRRRPPPSAGPRSARRRTGSGPSTWAGRLPPRRSSTRSWRGSGPTPWPERPLRRNGGLPAPSTGHLRMCRAPNLARGLALQKERTRGGPSGACEPRLFGRSDRVARCGLRARRDHEDANSNLSSTRSGGGVRADERSRSALHARAPSCCCTMTACVLLAHRASCGKPAAIDRCV